MIIYGSKLGHESWLVQVMAWWLFGTKPLAELMLIYMYFQVEPQEQPQWIFFIKNRKIFNQEKIDKCCLENGIHFV